MITPRTSQARDRRASGRWFFKLLALLVCGLSILGQASLGVALPTTQAAPSKASHSDKIQHSIKVQHPEKTQHSTNVQHPTRVEHPNKTQHSTNVQHPKKVLHPNINLTGPDLSIGVTHTPAVGPYTFGQQITYTLTVANDPTADPILVGTPITVTDDIPTGMTINGMGSNGDWNFTFTSATGPATITASYIGAYPVTAGETLSTITVTGILTSNAPTSLTNTASVSVTGDSNSANDSSTDTVTPIGPANDFSLAMSNGTTGCAIIGTNATFTLTPTNMNANTLPVGTTVTLTDTLPADLSSVSVAAPWTMSIVGSTLTASYTVSGTASASLPALTVTGTVSNTATTTLTNTATLAVPGDSNASNDTDNSSITVCPRPDLTIVKSHIGTGPFEVGQSVSYSLSVSNASSTGSVATGQSITVTDTIPTGLTSVTASGTNWTITPSSNLITATYVGAYPVAPSTTMSPITVTGTLTSSAIGSLNNTATVSTPLDNNSANDTSTDTLTVGPGPDLMITKTNQGTAPFQAGQSFSYVLSVSNVNGSGVVLPGQPIIVTDPIPAGLTSPVAVGTNWTTVITSGVLTATYTGSLPLAAGAALPNIILSGQLSNTAAPTLSNTATVSTPLDSNPTNDTSTDTLTVIGPDLMITKTHQGTGPFQAGQSFSYVLSVSNVGSGPVLAGQPIIVTDPIPAGLASPAAIGTNWTTVIAGGVLTATYIGSLPVTAGTALPNIILSGQLANAVSPTLSNTATVTTPDDINLANNSSTDAVSVLNQPDLTTSLIHQGSGCVTHGSVVYILGVNNSSSAGPVLSGPITVSATIPADVSSVNASAISDWNVTVTGNTVNATYTGSYPVAIGGALTAISITGILSNPSSASLVATATVAVPNESNSSNNNSSNALTICPPDLAITKIHQGTGPFQIGQNFSYVLTVSNGSASGPVFAPNSITVTDTLPAGFNSVTAVGTNWTTAIASGTLTATYTGTFPVVTGATLPTIVLSGQLASGLVSPFINTATVSTPGDSNSANNTSTDTVSVFNQPDLTTSLVHQGSGCVINGAVVYTFGVNNSASGGPVLSGPVTMSATIPSDIGGVTATAMSGWSVTTTGNTVNATYTGSYPIPVSGALPPITITGTLTNPSSASLLATATVTVPNESNSNNNNSSNALTICAPDLALAKTHQGTGPFQIGQNFSFVLTVSNGSASGPVFAPNSITVTDPIPASLTSVTAAGTNWTTTIASGILTATYTGTFPVVTGATLPAIVVSGQIGSGSVPPLTNTATVSTPGDSNPANNASTDTVSFLNQPDLTASLTHQGTGCNPSAAVNETLLVSNVGVNSGPVLSGPITLTFTLPSTLSNPVVTPGANWQVSNSGLAYTLTYLGSYPVNVGAIPVPVTITGTATSNSVVLNATVTTATDSNHANDGASDTLAICPPDLSITKTHQGTGPFQVGQTFSFVLSVSNGAVSGPVFTGNSITVTDQLPSGLSNPTAVGTNWTTAITGGILTATYAGTFPVLTSANLPTILVSGQLANAASPTLSNTATVSTAGDSNSTNDSSTDTVSVLTQPDLTTSLVHQGNGCVVSGAVIYTFGVNNSASGGPVLSGPVTMSATIPSDIGSVAATAVSGWSVTTTGNTVNATYTGSYPIPVSGALPPITITGTLTNPSSANLLATATVTVPNESNSNNNNSSNAITICPPDLGLVKSHLGTGPFQIGQNFSFILFVSNGTASGPIFAPNSITVTDPLPAGLTSVTAVGTNWTTAIASGTLTATYTGSFPVVTGAALPAIVVSGQIGSGLVPPLTLVNTATVSTLGDNNPTNDSSTDTVSVLTQPDLTTSLVHQGNSCFINGAVVYTLGVNNSANGGPVLSGPIIVSATIPSDIGGVAATAVSGWSVTTTGNTVNATYTGAYPIAISGALPPITITGTLTNPSSVSLLATATVAVPDESNSNNNNSSNALTICAPDLAIAKTHQGTGPFQIGQNFSFVLAVSNGSASGPVFAPNSITVTDPLPAGFNSVTAVGTNWTTVIASGTLTATYTGTFPVVTGATLPAIVLSGQLASGLVSPFINTAIVSTLSDSNPANNSSTDTVSVFTQPDLTTSLVHQGNSCFINGAVVYTLGVNNSANGGPVLSGPLTVSATIPSDIGGVAATPVSGWSVTITGNTVNATYIGSYPIPVSGALPPITITGTLANPSSASLLATATVAVPNESNSNNNNSSNALTICAPDLAIAKTHQGTGPFQIGQNFSFVLTVSNGSASGPVFAPNSITVTDPLPAGLTSVTAVGTNWTTTIASGILTATYTGTFPVVTGATLPAIVLSGQIGSGLVPPLTLTNTATVATLGDSNQANNASTDTVSVLNPPDLTVSLTHQGTGCNPSATVNETLLVSNIGANAGPVLSGPITVTFALPSGFINPVVAGTNWQVSNSGANYTLTYSGSYPVNALTSLAPVTITGNLTANSVVLNATVTTASDSNHADDAASDTFTVCAPDLAITKTNQGTGPFQVGQTFSYVLSVSNMTGSGVVLPGRAIIVTDHIPAGLTSPAAVGTNWSSVISGGILIATYTGSLPMAAGTALPDIILSGQLSNAAVPTLSNTANVFTPDDTNQGNNNSSDTVTVLPQPDLAVSLTHQGTGCNPSPAVNETLLVSNVGVNSGPVLSGPITLTFTLPSTLSNPVVTPGANWQMSNSGLAYTLTYSGSYPINVGAIPVPVTITGTATTNSVVLNATVTTATDSNHANDGASDTLAICPPDLAIVKSHQGTGPFQVGQTFSFVLSVSNGAAAGPVFAPNGITVTDTLPVSLLNPIAVGTNWTSTITGGILTATYTGAFPVLTSASLSNILVSGQLAGPASPTLSNTATVSTPGDSNAANNTSTDAVSVLTQPDLTVSLVHQGTACVVNGIVAYTLSVNNSANGGPVLSGPITVSATIPSDIGSVSATAVSGWSVTTTGNTVNATYTGAYPIAVSGALPPITITGTLSNPSSASLLATATVAVPNESNTSNNNASDTLTICAPDLALVKSHPGAGPFQIGQNFSFILSVSNGTASGSVFAPNSITVTDPLPAGLTSVTAVGTNWTIAIASGTLTATYTGSFPVVTGATLPAIVLSGQLGSGSVPNLVNTATVSTLGDSNPANNASTDTVAVLNQPDLTTSLTHQGTGCNPSTAVNETLLVSNVGANSGPVLSGPITLTFTLPSTLSNPVVTPGANWQMSNSGLAYTLTYSGSYPINVGAIPVPVTITGTATTNSVVLNATVTNATDSNHANDGASDTLAICPPDLSIVKSHQGTGPFQVGQSFSFILSVSNGAAAGPVFPGNGITVTDTLPASLLNPIAVGTNWTSTITGGILTATYTGAFPVLTSASLPNILVSGQLADAASPTLSNTATVSTPGDSNSANNSSTDTVPIVARPDLALSFSHGNAACNSTSAVSDTLSVRNNLDGGSILTGQSIVIHVAQPLNLTTVNLTATVPADWQVVHNLDQSWTATYTGSYPVATGQTLSTLTITGVATTHTPSISATISTLYDTNLSNSARTDSINICPPDLAITQTHVGSVPFQVGQTVNFILGVSDVAGSGPLLTGDPITVTDSLPAGLASLVATASSGWTTTIVSGVLTATYTGPLPLDPGATMPSIQLSGQLTTAALSGLSNTATVTVPGDSNPSNNSATDTFSVIPAPDLSLVVSGLVSCAHIGNMVSYSLLISNAANAGAVLAANPVTVSIPIPANFSNVTISGGWHGPTGPIIGGSTVTMTYAGSYPIAASATLPPITISGTFAMPSNAIAISGTVSTVTDTNASNNTGSGSITMCAPDITITKVHQGTGPFIVGNTVNYVLRVGLTANSDPILNAPITVTDALPVGLSAVTWAGTTWTFTNTNGTLTATYSGPYPLAVGSVLPAITISGQLNLAALPILSNTATVNMPGDSNLNNNSSTDQLPVQVGPDLRLSVSSSTSCVRPSNSATFTFNISNAPLAGYITTPITLTFRIPDGLTKVSFSGSGWQSSLSGSNVTVNYVGNQPVWAGQVLSPFKMTGVVTKVPNSTVTFSATVTVNNDSHPADNTSPGTLHVCSHVAAVNGDISAGANKSTIPTSTPTPGPNLPGLLRPSIDRQQLQKGN